MVPQTLLDEAFALAQLSPSNCNVQPWRVFLASGQACDRLRAALRSAIDAGDTGDAEDPIDTFPDEYRRRQVECATTLYRAMNIDRRDVAGRFRAMRRNYEFFDAPHVAVICMDKRFGIGVALDVGMYLQTLILALASRGVASCPQASLRNYPRVLRETLSIPDTLRVLCGVSIGYERVGELANLTRQPREPVAANVVCIAD